MEKQTYNKSKAEQKRKMKQIRKPIRNLTVHRRNRKNKGGDIKWSVERQNQESYRTAFTSSRINSCKTAMQFASKITVRKQARNEEITANAKSVLSVLGACIKSGDEIEVICEGSDETAALAEMIRIIEDGLGE